MTQISGALSSPEGGPGRRVRIGWPGIATLVAVLVCGLGANGFVAPEIEAHPPLSLTGELRSQIPGMSTGVGQVALSVGDNAVARNAQIPLTTMTVGRLAGFSQIQQTAPGYGTALKCLTQAIYYEAANEPERGKRAVAQVVLNRLRHPAY